MPPAPHEAPPSLAPDAPASELLVCAGLSHRRAPIAWRERFATLAADTGAISAQLAERLGAREALVVVTPGAVEAYVVAPGVGAADCRELVRHAADSSGIGERELAQRVELCFGEHAERRLVELAAGIDAPLLGATEVPRLLRAAFVAASLSGACGPTLDRLVGRALAAGRRVRVEAGLGAGRAALTGVAAELARRHRAECPRAGRALVLGATSRARVAAARLRNVGWPVVHMAEAAPFRLHAMLPCFDVVVTAADSPRLLTRYAVADALVERRAARREEPLLLIDLSLPRDIDPVVGQLHGAVVYDLDDIGAFGTRTAPEPAANLAAAHALIAQELARLASWPGAGDDDRVIAQSA